MVSKFSSGSRQLRFGLGPADQAMRLPWQKYVIAVHALLECQLSSPLPAEKTEAGIEGAVLVWEWSRMRLTAGRNCT